MNWEFCYAWFCTAIGVFLTESNRVVDLHISPESSSTLLVAWRRPTQSNGAVDIYLMRYRLMRVGDCPSLDPPGRWSRLLDMDNNQLRSVINDLVPYSRYQVKLWARTAAGRGQVAVDFANTATAGLFCICLCIFLRGLAV